MRPNPELIKNLWLEISRNRLVAVPLIFAVFYYFIYSTQDYLYGAGIITAAIWIFILGTGIWGAFLAESSMVQEIQNNTWPLVRLTSIKPWTMAWGKWLGATAFAWYLGFWNLAAILAAWTFIPTHDIYSDTSQQFTLFSHGPFTGILYLVGAAVLCQVVGLLAAFAHFQMKHTRFKFRGGLSIIVAFVVLAWLQPFSWSDPTHQEQMADWYGTEYDVLHFWLASILYFIAWALVGLYMNMRRQLQVANAPWVWLAFLVMFPGYVAGFWDGLEGIFFGVQTVWEKRVWLAGSMVLWGTYIMMLWEQTDGIEIRRLVARFQQRQWQKFLQGFPRWLITAGAALLLALGMFAFREWPEDQGTPYYTDGILMSFSLPSVLFMIRDIGLIQFFFLSKKPQRALGSAIVCLVLLYWILPGILGAVSTDVFIPLFLPWASAHSTHAIVAGLVEAGVMWFLVWYRWVERFQRSSLPG